MLKLTKEEEQMLKDVDYDSLAEMDNWTFAGIVSVSLLILVAMMWFIGKYCLTRLF